MPSVFGTIKQADGNLAVDINVKAFDVDVRRRELLGEHPLANGKYSIKYEPEQFQRAEKKCADLVVQAFDQDGNLLAESDIVFNACDDTRIDLVLQRRPVPEPEPQKSELERLEDSIAPLLEGLPYEQLTDAQVELLTEEEIRSGILGLFDRPRIRQRLEFLRLAARLEILTEILLAACYGWGRKDQFSAVDDVFSAPLEQVLDALLDVPIRTLRVALEDAIAENIIPDITAELPEIFDSIAGLRDGRGQVTRHFATLRLLDDASSKPLKGVTVAVMDRDADDEAFETLGQITANDQGLTRVDFPMRADAPEDGTRRLRLSLLSDDGTTRAEAEVALARQEPEIVEARFTLPPFVVGTDPLAGIVGDSAAAVLGQFGDDSFVGIARQPRDEFVDRIADDLGDERDADSLYYGARAVAHVVNHGAISTWLSLKDEPDDETGGGAIVIPELKGLIAQFLNCSCRDCESALSPAAYLALLMDWIQDHVKDGDVALTPSALEARLFQPFARFPSSCGAVEAQVRHVRLACEVLRRRFPVAAPTNAIPLDDILNFAPEPTGFANRYRSYLEAAYRSLLSAYGVAWESLRDALVATERSVAEGVAARLGVTTEALGGGLYLDLEPGSANAVTEERLEAIFGLRDTREDSLATLDTPLLLDLQRQQLAAAWRGLDWANDDWGPEPVRPVVEPDVMSAASLRTQEPASAAEILFTERRETLDNRRAELDAMQPVSNGIEALVQDELGRSVAALRDLAADLQDDTTAEAAEATLVELHLEVAALQRLLEIDDVFAANAELSDEDAVDASDILVRAHRGSLYEDWIGRESDDGVLLGPHDFLLPPDTEPAPSPFLATPDEREAWLTALSRRRQPALIDPGVLDAEDIKQFPDSGFGEAVSEEMRDAVADRLLQRTGWARDRRDVFSAARAGAVDDTSALDATLEASGLGGSLALIDEIEASERAGHPVRPRLDGLDLGTDAFRLIQRLRARIGQGLSVEDSDWSALDDALLQMEKRRLAAIWADEERRDAIYLHPQLLHIPDDEGESASATPRSAPDEARRRETRDTLTARAGQIATLASALTATVGSTEEATLPALREALILSADIAVDSLEERTQQLEDELLIDLRRSGCALTTHIAFAVDAIRKLVQRGYDGEHSGALEDINVDREAYATEFEPSLSTYQAWRAVGLAYLYPEAALNNAVPAKHSYGFGMLLAESGTGMTASRACELAKTYSDYFADVSDLEVEATCQASTYIPGANPCAALEPLPIQLCHVFARARRSGNVYVARFQTEQENTDTLTSWEPVEILEPVNKIIGSAPHHTALGKRYIVLFIQRLIGGKHSLHAARFDLDTFSWHEPTELSLPPGAGSGFNAVVIQKRGATDADTAVGGLGLAPSGAVKEPKPFPTLVAVQTRNLVIYLHILRDDGLDWRSVDWLPLYGLDFAHNFVEVLAMVQKTDDSYVLFVGYSNGWVWYRVLFLDGPGNDTGEWHRSRAHDFLGAVPWPEADLVYFFGGSELGTHQFALGSLNPVGRLLVDTISAFDSWLKKTAGVSLQSFRFRDFRPSLFNPKEIPGEFVDPMNPGDIDVEEAPLDLAPFNGTLLEALKRVIGDFADLVRPSSEIGPYGQSYLEAQFLYKAFTAFRSAIAAFPGSRLYGDELSKWKLADLYVRSFCFVGSDENDVEASTDLVAAIGSLVQDLLLKLLDSPIKSHGKIDDSSISNLNVGARVYRRKWLQQDVDEAPRVGLPFSGHLLHAPSAFEAESGIGFYRDIVYRGENGTFRIRYRKKIGQSFLSAVTPYRITPHHEGPLTILPEREREFLQLRRTQIASAYAQLSGAPQSVKMYIIEAYRLIPLRLARDLEDAGVYEEALDWLSLVFDWRAPPAERFIDYGLELEKELDLSFDDMDAWLESPTDVFAIAATRRGTWGNHVAQLAAGILIEYADALFTIDAPRENSRAMDLYERALDLLGRLPSNPFWRQCANIIGRLEIDLTNPIHFPVKQFQAALGQIPDPDRLDNVLGALTQIANDPGPSQADRIRQMRALIQQEVRTVPAPPNLSERIDHGRAMSRSFEQAYLASPIMQPRLRQVSAARSDRRRRAINAIALAQPTTDSAEASLSWLRVPVEPLRDSELTALTGFNAFIEAPPERSAVAVAHQAAPMQSLRIIEPLPPPPAPPLALSFCIPRNTLEQALRERALANLEKLRTCRNIAGFVRQLNPYGGEVGLGAGIGRDGIIASRVSLPRTQYNAVALLTRAEQLVAEAQRVEERYQHELETAEREDFTVLQFSQQAKVTAARTRLADLQIDTAVKQVGLARRELGAASFEVSALQQRIDGGYNEHEQAMLTAYTEVEDAKIRENEARTASAIVEATAAAAGAVAQAKGPIGKIVAAASQAPGLATAATQAGLRGKSAGDAIRAETDIKQAGFAASHERQKEAWELQRGVAQQKTQIAKQQIAISRSQLAVTRQEREIAALEERNAAELLDFLVAQRTFTAELHRWIARILGQIYRYFLQQAASTARLAEDMQAWERQTAPGGLIKADYWTMTPTVGMPAAPEAATRLGLTGSARLNRDIQELRQLTFEARQRDQLIRYNIDLGQRFPVEFQAFRQTGRLVFSIGLADFEREFPGHYLCLVRGVAVSLVALVPTVRGIRLSLTSSGVSRAVVEGDTFSTVTLNAQPERIVFTGVSEAAGPVALTPEDQSLRQPYDGTGIDSTWLIELQPALNPFDFNSIATVTLSLELSTRFSFDYERQLLAKRDPRVEGEVAFSFRNDFPDQWYDLNHPDLTPRPMVVELSTTPRDFPPNLRNLRIRQVGFYAVRAEGETAEVTVASLRFRADGERGSVGGGFSTVEGIASTRAASGLPLIPIIGKSVSGTWELAFADDPSMENRPRDLFADERITDLLLVVTFAGDEPPWQY